jgi:hypothetical protein
VADDIRDHHFTRARILSFAESLKAISARRQGQEELPKY